VFLLVLLVSLLMMRSISAYLTALKTVPASYISTDPPSPVCRRVHGATTETTPLCHASSNAPTTPSPTSLLDNVSSVALKVTSEILIPAAAPRVAPSKTVNSQILVQIYVWIFVHLTLIFLVRTSMMAIRHV